MPYTRTVVDIPTKAPMAGTVKIKLDAPGPQALDAVYLFPHEITKIDEPAHGKPSKTSGSSTTPRGDEGEKAAPQNLPKTGDVVTVEIAGHRYPPVTVTDVYDDGKFHGEYEVPVGANKGQKTVGPFTPADIVGTATQLRAKPGAPAEPA